MLKPGWDNWVKNEFLHQMRAKGKLPRPCTTGREALERKERSYHYTAEKVFPEAKDPHELMMDAVALVSAQPKRSRRRNKEHRASIKERLSALEQEYRQERDVRKQVEAEVQRLTGATEIQP